MSDQGLSDSFDKMAELLTAVAEKGNGSEDIALVVTKYAQMLPLAEYIQFLEELLTEIGRYGAAEVTRSIRSVTHPNDRVFPLLSRLPKIHIKPNNKLANEITRNMIGEGSFQLVVSRAGAKNEIVTRVKLDYQADKVKLTGDEAVQITSFDRLVYDAVTTLFVAGNEVVTPEMVYRATRGMTESEFPGAQGLLKVRDALEKGTKIWVEIDFTKEAQAYGKDIDKAMYEGWLLACDKITVSVSGHIKEAYKLLRVPILYNYAKISGQILSIPITLLQTKSAVRGTEETLIIQDYLIRQIEGMKSSHFKRSNKIVFQKIYNELNMDDLTPDAFKQKSAKIRKHANAILNDLVEKKYIRDFSQYYKGKTIQGVEIRIN